MSVAELIWNDHEEQINKDILEIDIRVPTFDEFLLLNSRICLIDAAYTSETKEMELVISAYRINQIEDLEYSIQKITIVNFHGEKETININQYLGKLSNYQDSDSYNIYIDGSKLQRLSFEPYKEHYGTGYERLCCKMVVDFVITSSFSRKSVIARLNVDNDDIIVDGEYLEI